METNAATSTRKCNNPIFIVGCGHSGTSLLVRILAEHSQLHGITKETAVFQQSDLRYARWHFSGWLRLLFKRKSLLESFDQACNAAGKTRWAEKTPSHIHHIKKIFSTYPLSQLLFIVRDGRDVCCSIAARNGSFRKAISRWKRDNEAMLPYLNDNRVLLVKYEELISKQQTEIDRILDFLRLPSEPLVEIYNQSRSIRSSTREQFRSNLPQYSYERHDRLRESQLAQKLYEGSSRWLSELGPHEKSLMQRHANHLLKRFGYIQSFAW